MAYDWAHRQSNIGENYYRYDPVTGVVVATVEVQDDTTARVLVCDAASDVTYIHTDFAKIYVEGLFP